MTPSIILGARYFVAFLLLKTRPIVCTVAILNHCALLTLGLRRSDIEGPIGKNRIGGPIKLNHPVQNMIGPLAPSKEEPMALDTIRCDKIKASITDIEYTSQGKRKRIKNQFSRYQILIGPQNIVALFCPYGEMPFSAPVFFLSLSLAIIWTRKPHSDTTPR